MQRGRGFMGPGSPRPSAAPAGMTAQR
jgi:hypothetical protein